MKKISKILLLTTLLVLLIGVVNATEMVSNDKGDTADTIVADDSGTVSQKEYAIQNNE